jgi:hypothetical protein
MRGGDAGRADGDDDIQREKPTATGLRNMPRAASYQEPIFGFATWSSRTFS